MRRHQYQNRAQLVLELEHQNPRVLVARGTKGLVETLVDLLLEALGVDEATRKGGADEHQDHA